ncbi:MULTISPECIES: flavodoxin family protein [Corynebacterium]|uniref:Flavodoxin n=1 Tax=Corynebacterium amycolatum TaxID=43765 RepID=A0AB38XWK6_CORAY|nr:MULTISPECIES: flavodoxin [Corynebacterium]AIN82842.1 NADPH-dependent FMN reductase family protein [Corynebacterium sp. ATCC 6931]MBC6726024.1 flavodoxin [Corynebacterium amycolatum]MBC6758975.1 flavodoxin [Corynebacterium sp. LK24]MDY7340979.1 flavodoxin [Corynebacterium amycolatum]OFU57689.1 flavodoxin [Corynebacterium sp. HMSC11H10]
MPTLLVVHHSPTPLLQEVLSHVLEGANDPALEGVDVKVVEALDATIDDLTSADAILLGTSANFGYISGALKHFFDTTFREAQEVTKGLPFSYWIRGGFDTTGAENAMKTITTGYKWELAAEPVVFVGSLDDDISDRLVNLGGTMAAQILG